PAIIDDLRARGYTLVTVPELVIPCSTALPPAATSAVVVNTGGAGLRCRTSPSTSSGVIAVVAEGMRVAVRGAMANQWVPVTCANQSGWMFASYLRLETGTTPSPTPTPTPPSTGLVGVVSNTGGANLRCRTQPSTSSGIIVNLPEGST